MTPGDGGSADNYSIFALLTFSPGAQLSSCRSSSFPLATLTKDAHLPFFFGQAPLLLVSFALVAFKLNIRLPDAIANEGTSSKLARIDFLGSFTLVVSVASLLSAFTIKTTEELPWSHPLIYGLLTVSGIFGAAFVYVEAQWAPYPVMPLRLISQRTPLAVALVNFMASMTAFSMVRVSTNQYVSSMTIFAYSAAL